MDYEYKHLRVVGDRQFQAYLNDFAKKRWRVVGFSHDGGTNFALLERKV